MSLGRREPHVLGNGSVLKQHMTAADGEDWISVAQYSDALSARIEAGLLDGMGIPNRIEHYPRTVDWYLWVPPEFETDAREALKQAPISEEELTEEALKEPPPDDA